MASSRSTSFADCEKNNHFYHLHALFFLYNKITRKRQIQVCYGKTSGRGPTAFRSATTEAGLEVLCLPGFARLLFHPLPEDYLREAE